VRLPLLSLSLGSNNLLLSIRQGLGSSYEIQQINSLSQTNWTAVLSLQLTNDPQTAPLPLPTNSASFWRVRMLLCATECAGNCAPPAARAKRHRNPDSAPGMGPAMDVR